MGVVPGEDAAAANESQLSDASALTLERNSFNFLEYSDYYKRNVMRQLT